MRLITVQNNGGKIFINDFFVGDLTRKIELPKYDEGTLYWMDDDRLPDYDTSFAIKQAATLSVNPDEHAIWLKVISSSNEQICWNTL